MLHDNIAIFDELESLDIEDDNDFESMEFEDENDFDIFDIPSWTSERGGKVLVNVDSFGAVGDGVSDDTQVNNILFTCILIFCFIPMHFKLLSIG